MGLALSTSWNAQRYSEGKALIFEITGLGFEEVELSFNLTSRMVEDIGILVREGRVRVVSVHNFCPAPDTVSRDEALPDCYSLASLDEAERLEAVRFSKKSIDTASQLKAQAVVLHCGRVEIPDATRPLIELHRKGLAGSDMFLAVRQRAIQERTEKQGPFLDAVLKSLKALTTYAADKGTRLGVETRFYYREIPSQDEIAVILGKFPDPVIGYWHDVGHAQLMEDLGFANHRAYLERYGARMLGIHLHGIAECRDHLPPPKGDFDFTRLAPYITKDTIKVIEAHTPATAQEVRESREYLKRSFDGKI